MPPRAQRTCGASGLPHLLDDLRCLLPGSRLLGGRFTDIRRRPVELKPPCRGQHAPGKRGTTRHPPNSRAFLAAPGLLRPSSARRGPYYTIRPVNVRHAVFSRPVRHLAVALPMNLDVVDRALAPLSGGPQVSRTSYRGFDHHRRETGADLISSFDPIDAPAPCSRARSTPWLSGAGRPLPPVGAGRSDDRARLGRSPTSPSLRCESHVCSGMLMAQRQLCSRCIVPLRSASNPALHVPTDSQRLAHSRDSARLQRRTSRHATYRLLKGAASPG